MSTNRACTLLETNCVINLSIIGGKTRTTRIMINGPMEEKNVLVLIISNKRIGEKGNISLEGCSQIFKNIREIQDPV